MREFHAQARVFNIFYMNFVLSMDTLEEKITKLEEKKNKSVKISTAILIFREVSFP